jgi:hypothetical protein
MTCELKVSALYRSILDLEKRMGEEIEVFADVDLLQPQHRRKGLACIEKVHPKVFKLSCSSPGGRYETSQFVVLTRKED